MHAIANCKEPGDFTRHIREAEMAHIDVIAFSKSKIYSFNWFIG